MARKFIINVSKAIKQEELNSFLGITHKNSTYTIKLMQALS